MTTQSTDTHTHAEHAPTGSAGGEVAAPERGVVPVSVVILTLNEEINIGDCINSCSWCDDVHVLDSGSKDRTVEIAESLDARVHHNPFESFGAQRNWAIDNIPMKHAWVFHLDADERFTPALVDELRRVLERDPGEAGFFVPHKLMFLGRWLRRSGGYPTYQMRFFHKERMRFIDHGHGQREAPGTTLGKLEEPYLHFLFSKGLYEWLDKHNRYSSLEALQAERDGPRLPRPGRLFSRDAVERRRAWKELGFRMPFRPAVRYLITLFVLGGIFEGKAGRTYAALLATYERMIDMKLAFLRSNSYRLAGHTGFEREFVPAPDTAVFYAPDRPTKSPDAAAVRRGPGAGMPKPVEPDRSAVSAIGQLTPESSPWTFNEKVRRAVWMLIGKPLFRTSFHNWYGYRNWLLRRFGATIASDVRIRPSVNIEIPWNLDIRDGVTVGDHAILYSLGIIVIGERTIVSQYAHICAGTHDYTHHEFPLIRDPIVIGADAWIGADAFVGPAVTIGSLSVLGARSSAYKDLEARTVYVGNPAKPIKERELR